MYIHHHPKQSTHTLIRSLRSVVLMVGALCVFVVLITAAGCATPPSTSTTSTTSTTTTSAPLSATHTISADVAPEQRKVTMRLQWIPQYQFAGYIVALMNGYYTDEGLDVTLLPGSPDFVPLPLVVSGNDTFGSTGADTIFIAREKGIPVVALATWFQMSPVGFMVHRDSGITEPTDFVGKTVGVFYGDNVETEYRALLAATNVARETINEVPAEFYLEPFLSRRVDVMPVYVTDQPDLAQQQGADVSLIIPRDYGSMLMGDVLFTTETFVRDYPATTRAFVAATLRGWDYALTHPDETVGIIAEYNKQLSPAHLAFEGDATIPLIRDGVGRTCPGWNDTIHWQHEQQQLLDLNIILDVVPIETVIDNRFVQHYYEQNGTLCP